MSTTDATTIAPPSPQEVSQPQPVTPEPARIRQVTPVPTQPSPKHPPVQHETIDLKELCKDPPGAKPHESSGDHVINLKK